MTEREHEVEISTIRRRLAELGAEREALEAHLSRVVEFFDYNCPYCRRVAPRAPPKGLVADYGTGAAPSRCLEARAQAGVVAQGDPVQCAGGHPPRAHARRP